MAEIARRAGGSKATLYNHFRSKLDLLQAVIQKACSDLEWRPPEVSEDLRSDLGSLARRVSALLDSARMQALLRLVQVGSGEAELGPELYRRCHAPLFFDVAAILDSHAQAGRLRLGSAAMAAEEFVGLVLGAGQVLAIRHLRGQAECDSSTLPVDDALSFFVCRYGAATMAS